MARVNVGHRQALIPNTLISNDQGIFLRVINHSGESTGVPATGVPAKSSSSAYTKTPVIESEIRSCGSSLRGGKWSGEYSVSKPITTKSILGFRALNSRARQFFVIVL